MSESGMGAPEPAKGGEEGEDLILTFSYDARGRLCRAEDGKGACVRYAYDARGNRVGEERRIGGTVWSKTRCCYDRAGRLSEMRETLDDGLEDGPQAPSGGRKTAVTQYRRDKNGNITQICLPEGGRILREYDLRDRMVLERVLDEANGIDRRTLVSYDRAGNPASVRRQGGENGEQHALECEYDLKDRLIHAKENGGAVFEYGYDKNDRLVRESVPSGAGRRTTEYAYDLRGRMTKKRCGDGEETNQYDLMGRLVAARQADGEEYAWSYGIGGEMAAVESAMSRRRGRARQSYRYNSRGQVTGIRDGNGNETILLPDAWGRTAGLKRADGGTEGYAYDCAGNVTRATDANGGTVAYRYNSRSQVCEITDQDGGSEYRCYDLEGRRSLSIDRLGGRIETRYNVDGNPVLEISRRGDGSGREVRSWTYDAMGRLKEASSGGFRYRYEYHGDGRLARKESGGRQVAAYTYYPDGSVKTRTDASGKTWTHLYDGEGRLSAIQDERGRVAVSYRHTPGGKVREILHGNGVATACEYDGEGNLSRLMTKAAGGQVLCDLKYEYDGEGNRVCSSGSMALPGEDGSVRLQARDVRYGYDASGRLALERRGGREWAYRYDLCGNRLEKTGSGGGETYQYNGRNQLTKRETPGGTWEYAYDAQGNLVKASGPEGETRYEYNGRNQESRALSGGIVIQENFYDGEGLRAGLRERGKRKAFLFEDGEITAELDESGRAASLYLRGYGAEAVERGGERHAIHRDERSGTAYLTGSGGEVENAYDYDAFGLPLSRLEGIENRLLYAGQQYDPETGRYYLRSRYYDPSIGRFTQEDANRGDGLNLYAYCGNNPVSYYDPSGLCADANEGNIQKNAKRGNVTVSEGESGTKNSQGYLDEALERQGLEKTPNNMKESWTEDGYKYEVRVHEANPDYGQDGSIYRVSRQKQGTNANGQGYGTEYMDSNGVWHHTSTLKPQNPSYNAEAAANTHIPVPK